MEFQFHYCPRQQARPSLSWEEIQSGNKKRELDELQKQYIQEKSYNVVERYEGDWWKLNRTDNIVEQHRRDFFLRKMPLREESHLQNIKSWSLFGFVQYDIQVPKNLQEVFANFPLIFKNSEVGRDKIDPFMEEYAEKGGLLAQPRRMLISSFFLENGKIITPLLLLYLDFGLVSKKNVAFCNLLQWNASTNLINLR